MEVFAAAARQRFEDQAVAHAVQFAPKHTGVLGQEGTRAVVRLGIERAGKYGFTASGPVHFYLDLMFVLGSEFDTDPQYPWVAQTLNDASLPGQMPRVDRLYEHSIAYLDRVAGPDNQFARQALRRVQTMRSTGLLQKCDAAALQSIYPEKAAYLGEQGVRDLIARSSARASGHGLTSQAAAVLLTALEFSLGHAFDHDPLYPWIGATLDDSAIRNPEDRVRRLYQKTTTYLEHAIAYLEQRHDGKI